MRKEELQQILHLVFKNVMNEETIQKATGGMAFGMGGFILNFLKANPFDNIIATVCDNVSEETLEEINNILFPPPEAEETEGE